MRRPPLKWLVSGAIALGILGAGLALSFRTVGPWRWPGATATAQNVLPTAPEAWRGEIDDRALDECLVRRADQREVLFDLERLRRGEAGDDTPLLLDKAIGNLLRMWGED